MSLIPQTFTLKENAFFILSLGWLISLPFGAHIFPISFGFLTIYPHLIFTLLIACYLPFSFFKLRREFRYLIIFQILWLCSSIIWCFFHGFDSFSIFDVRSLILMLLFAVVIGLFDLHFNSEKKQHLLNFGLTFFLLVLVVFGFIEFLFGFHFSGATTLKYLQIDIINNFYYAPFFIYDNPNDYLVYLLFIAILFIIFNEKAKANFFIRLSIYLIILIFSIYSDSKFAKIIILTVLFFELLNLSYIKFRSLSKWTKYALLIGSLFVFILIATKPIYVGPIFRSPLPTINLNPTELDSSKQQIVSVIDSLEPNKKALDLEDQSMKETLETEEIGSMQIRLNLIKNGLLIFKNHPIFGAGPGQFNKIHATGQQKYPTGTIVGPHNYFIELLSKFGIICFLYIAVLAYLFYLFMRMYFQYKCKRALFVLILIVSFPLLSSMPSSFLYLEVNHLFLPILLLILGLEREKLVQKDLDKLP